MLTNTDLYSQCAVECQMNQLPVLMASCTGRKVPCFLADSTNRPWSHTPMSSPLTKVVWLLARIGIGPFPRVHA
jgi:hypothetical protein